MPRKTKHFDPENGTPGSDCRLPTSNKSGPSGKTPKIATIRPKFAGHLGNPGLRGAHFLVESWFARM